MQSSRDRLHLLVVGSTRMPHPTDIALRHGSSSGKDRATIERPCLTRRTERASHADLISLSRGFRRANARPKRGSKDRLAPSPHLAIQREFRKRGTLDVDPKGCAGV
jgi:hypothetical protein